MGNGKVTDKRHPYPCAKNTVIPVPNSLDILTRILNKEIEADATVFFDENNEECVLSYNFKKITTVRIE